MKSPYITAALKQSKRTEAGRTKVLVLVRFLGGSSSPLVLIGMFVRVPIVDGLLLRQR